ncbi:MAG: phosphatase PAP2 family protein [Bacteroidia bacterium]|nr:phosphatase PAP2 family protein [Bacteroidia bacterium]
MSFINKKKSLFASLFFLLIVLVSFYFFLEYNENRKANSFSDPVLRLFSPVDVSLFIFISTYFFGLIGLVLSFKKTALFLQLLQSFCIMMLLRMLCMYLFPLEPPVTIIPLNDILLEFSFYAGRPNLKDLFFSGHTATIFLFVFLFQNKFLKFFFLIGGVLVGAGILLQHVHYSIDVIVAPFASYISVQLQKYIASVIKSYSTSSDLSSK